MSRIIENGQSIKKKTLELKGVPFANIVICEDNLLVCEDEDDYELKRCETLNDRRICCVKGYSSKSHIE